VCICDDNDNNITDNNGNIDECSTDDHDNKATTTSPRRIFERRLNGRRLLQKYQLLFSSARCDF
jgi:hypothetical protein